mgnify:CR=1 FL=1
MLAAVVAQRVRQTALLAAVVFFTYRYLFAVGEEAQRNRMLLLGLMSAAGWDFYGNEWWHYQLFAARRYPLLSDSAAGTNMMPPGRGR